MRVELINIVCNNFDWSNFYLIKYIMVSFPLFILVLLVLFYFWYFSMLDLGFLMFSLMFGLIVVIFFGFSDNVSCYTMFCVLILVLFFMSIFSLYLAIKGGSKKSDSLGLMMLKVFPDIFFCLFLGVILFFGDGVDLNVNWLMFGIQIFVLLGILFYSVLFFFGFWIYFGMDTVYFGSYYLHSCGLVSVGVFIFFIMFKYKWIMFGSYFCYGLCGMSLVSFFFFMCLSFLESNFKKSLGYFSASSSSILFLLLYISPSVGFIMFLYMSFIKIFLFFLMESSKVKFIKFNFVNFLLLMLGMSLINCWTVVSFFFLGYGDVYLSCAEGSVYVDEIFPFVFDVFGFILSMEFMCVILFLIKIFVKMFSLVLNGSGYYCFKNYVFMLVFYCVFYISFLLFFSFIQGLSFHSFGFFLLFCFLFSLNMWCDFYGDWLRKILSSFSKNVKGKVLYLLDLKFYDKNYKVFFFKNYFDGFLFYNLSLLKINFVSLDYMCFICFLIFFSIMCYFLML